MSEGHESTPSFMALLLAVRVFVECEANLVSYFDPMITQIFGE
jgi:hypothetical protein